MFKNYTNISLWTVLAALISWTLTIVLVVNMLGGPFAQRTCQTHCIQILAIASFLTACAGTLLWPRRPQHPLTTLCLLSMLGLIVIYLTTFFIGVLFS